MRLANGFDPIPLLSVGNDFSYNLVENPLHIHGMKQPPMPTEQDDAVAWYYIRDRKKVGPISWNQLRDLAAKAVLRPTDMVLREGAGKWCEASAVAGMFDAVGEVDTLTVLESLEPSVENSGTLGLPATVSGLPTFGVEATPPFAKPIADIPGYVMLGELGRGGMGVVFKAEHSKLKRVVALKMLLGGASGTTSSLERFRTEAEAIARLHHPNIVQIYEVGEHDGMPYFSLEYCEGGSLSQRLRGTPLPPREAARLVEILAHQGNLIHRDLKPANVLLARDGAPQITDFGLAKKLDDAEGVTQSGAIMGTPSYMPPEQALGKNKELGPAVDIYSLGAILYEMLTGRPPFKGASTMDTLLQVATDEPVPPSRLQSKAAGDIETICLKCLDKSALRRYASAQALAEDLGRYLRGEPITARPAGLAERTWKWARRRPAVGAADDEDLGVLGAYSSHRDSWRSSVADDRAIGQLFAPPVQRSSSGKAPYSLASSRLPAARLNASRGRSMACRSVQ